MPNQRFLIRRQGHDQCIKAQQDDTVIVTSCSSPTSDMFWIWTGKESGLLTNIQTLKCMAGIMPDGGQDRDDGGVGMKPCQEEYNLQKMKCHFKERQYHIAWEKWAKNGRDLRSQRFLQLNDKNDIVAAIDSGQIWNNKKRKCGNKTTYTGNVM